jgi:hypothetical protein
MRFPPLFSIAHPTGPQWATPALEPEELRGMMESLVAFVGYDDATNQIMGLGTGTIIAAHPEQLVILTACHGFIEWTDKVRPPKPHAFRGLAGDTEDLKARLHPLITAGRIRALVELNGVPRFLKIGSFSAWSNPRAVDCAIVQIVLPEELRADAESCRAIPIDCDGFPFDEPVVLAGLLGLNYVGPDPFTVEAIERQLCVRVGHVIELTDRPDGGSSSMFRAAIPTLPGMSGGPMLRLRRTIPGPSSLIKPIPTLLPTVVGVISRSRIGGLLDIHSCPEGDTWVTPISSTALLEVSDIEHGSVKIPEAIRRDWIASHGDAAKRMRVQIEGDRWTVRYE